MCILCFLLNLWVTLWMLVDGFIMFCFEFRDCVYECGLETCLLGGFCDVVLFCISIIVHSLVGVCAILLLLILSGGQILVVSVCIICGGG